MDLRFTATGPSPGRLRRSRRPPTRAFSLILGVIAVALVLGRGKSEPPPPTPTPPPGPRIQWDRERIDFDAQAVRSSSAVELIGTNVGAGGIVVGKLGLEGPDARDFRVEKDGCSGKKLAPGEPCHVSVGFLPETPGTKTGQLSIRGEAGAEPPSLTLQGRALEITPSPIPPTDTPTLTPAPVPTDTPVPPETARPAAPTAWLSWRFEPFGAIRALPAHGEPVRHSMTLTNNAAMGTRIRLLAEPPAIFQIDAASCTSLTPQGSCSFVVVFWPRNFQRYEGTLLVKSDRFAPVKIPLSGEGVRP